MMTMNNTLISILLACIVLIQCKSIERPESKVESSVNEVAKQPSVCTDLRDTLYSYDYIVYLSDTLSLELVKPTFHKYKDSLTIDDLYHKRENPYSEESWQRSTKEVIRTLPRSTEGFLIFFMYIAKSGDTEAEAWLLDFYDRYFSYCVKRYESGYIRDLYIEPRTPIDPSDFRRIKQIFPSIIKVNLLAKLYGVQSGMGGGFCLDCEVYSAVRRDMLDPNQAVVGYGDFVHLYKADRERANQVFQELLDGIRSGNIKLRPRK